jgi:hypothetical protein
MPAGKPSNLRSTFSSESGTFFFPPQLSFENQLGNPSSEKKNPIPKRNRRHEDLISTRSSSTEKVIQKQSIPHNFTLTNFLDENHNSDINLNAKPTLQKEITDDKKLDSNYEKEPEQKESKASPKPIEISPKNTTKISIVRANSQPLIIKTKSQTISRNVTKEISGDLKLNTNENNKEVTKNIIKEECHGTNDANSHPEINLSKTKLEQLKPCKKKKTFNDDDEQKLWELMKYRGYSKEEICDKIDRKRAKYSKKEK